MKSEYSSKQEWHRSCEEIILSHRLLSDTLDILYCFSKFRIFKIYICNTYFTQKLAKYVNFKIDALQKYIKFKYDSRF